MNIIEKEMIKKGLNQESIGNKIGLSQPSVSLLVNGKLKSIKIDVARRLSDVLGVSIDDIYKSLEIQNAEFSNDNDIPDIVA